MKNSRGDWPFFPVKITVTTVLMRAAAMGILLALAATPAFGNGGTFDTSAVQRTGNLEPVRQNKIELAEESIRVVIDGEFADVEVDYRLVNRGGPTVLTYGFPVDVGNGANASERESLSFGIFDGSRRIPIGRVIEKELPAKARSRLWENHVADRPVRKWHMVTMKFLPRETKQVSVRYRARNFGQMSGTSNDVFWGQTPREFLYTLRPSACWGTGRVGRLSIEVDLRKLRSIGVPVTEVSLPGYSERDGIYRWELADYDLRRAPDLKVVYDLKAVFQSEAAQREMLPRKAIESVTVSSTRAVSRTTRATYGVGNLTDRNFATAWIEGGNGIGKGEWIEVRFKKGWSLRFVALANGYWKSPKSFVENGWIKKLRLDWTWGGDLRHLQNGGRESETITLKKPEFDVAPQKLPYGRADVLEEFGEMGGGEGVRRLRITILDADPGTASSDTAVSELFFGGEELDRDR